MERFIRTFADALDRRSFLRSVGKLGMGAAAVAGVLLLPRKAFATCAPCTGTGNVAACVGQCDGAVCRSGSPGRRKVCVQGHDTDAALTDCECLPVI